MVNPFCAKGRSSPLLSAGMRASLLTGVEAPGGTRLHDNNNARLKFLDSLPEKQAFFFICCYALTGGKTDLPQVLLNLSESADTASPGRKGQLTPTLYIVNLFARPQKRAFFLFLAAHDRWHIL